MLDSDNCFEEEGERSGKTGVYYFRYMVREDIMEAFEQKTA